MKKRTCFYLIIPFFIGISVLPMLLAFCKKENKNTDAALKIPVVITDETSNITVTTATSGGNVMKPALPRSH